MGKQKFPIKLFKIINDPNNNDIVRWSDDGKNIIIKIKNNRINLSKLLKTMPKAKSKFKPKSKSEPNPKSESISESNKDTNFNSVHKQLNLYGFSKKRDNNEDEIKFFLKDFYRGQKEEIIEDLKPKNLKKKLKEIKDNNNVEEKIDGYLNLIEDRKININNNLLNHVLKFLVERKEQRRNITQDIRNLKNFYENINSNDSG